jgi:hypothetical protein
MVSEANHLDAVTTRSKGHPWRAWWWVARRDPSLRSGGRPQRLASERRASPSPPALVVMVSEANHLDAVTARSKGHLRRAWWWIARRRCHCDSPLMTPGPSASLRVTAPTFRERTPRFPPLSTGSCRHGERSEPPRRDHDPIEGPPVACKVVGCTPRPFASLRVTAPTSRERTPRFPLSTGSCRHGERSEPSRRGHDPIEGPSVACKVVDCTPALPLRQPPDDAGTLRFAQGDGPNVSRANAALPPLHRLLSSW